MAETVSQRNPSGEAGAGRPASEDLSAEVPMLLRVPAPGEVLAVTVEAGGAYVVDPAAQGLGLEMAWRGDDLVLAFSGAGSIRLQGAARLAEAVASPLVILPDGTELGIDRLYAMLDTALEDAPLETAAGPDTAEDDVAPDDGFHGYNDYQGEASLAGLAGTGALGEVALSVPSSFGSLDDPGLGGESTGDGTSGASDGGTGDGGTGGGGDDGDGSDDTVVADGGGTGGASSSGEVSDGGDGDGADDGLTLDGGPGSGNSNVPNPGNGGGNTTDSGPGTGNGGGNGNSQAQSDDDSHGKSGDDRVTGGDGDDHLVGGASDDTLDGGAGDDTLNGGAGDDTLIGGLGDDDLQGGSGADVFRFDLGHGDGDFGTDIVRDFDPDAGDVLSFVNVIDIDSNSNGTDLDDLLSTIISEVEDDGRDVTIEFDGGGIVVLEGFGTGTIDSANALLNEIGQASVAVA